METGLELLLIILIPCAAWGAQLLSKENVREGPSPAHPPWWLWRGMWRRQVSSIVSACSPGHSPPPPRPWSDMCVYHCHQQQRCRLAHSPESQHSVALGEYCASGSLWTSPPLPAGTSQHLAHEQSRAQSWVCLLISKHNPSP